jgi:cyclopropane fatty-acyl-phospholipid synthase-like methyltransferase
MHPLDPRRVLSSPLVYSAYRALVTGQKEHRVFAEEYVRARPGQRILDVGCGPADLLDDLPERVDYTGFDTSASYIAEATRRYGHRARFLQRHVDRQVVDELGAGSFDRVLAHGLLHHLNDDEVVEFFELSRHALSADGHLVTLDGCFVAGQSRAARFLLEQDRGRFVRDEASYVALAKRVFADVRADIRHDMYRIPYTLILLECSP